MDRAYYGTDTRAYQLLAGALLALTPQLFVLGARIGRAARSCALAALIGLFLVGSSLLSVSAISRGIVTVALTFALIVALEASRGGIARRVLSQPPVAYLGRISYATYLWHWPLVVLIGLHHAVDPAVLFVIIAPGSTALAALSYHLVEHPIRVSTTLGRYNRPVIALGLAISFVAGLAVAPPYLRWRSDRHTNVAALSVRVASLRTTGTQLLDWRKARADGPPRPDCYRRPVADCTLVRGTGPSILLLGDSTARMWAPAFLALARRESFTVSLAASDSCPWQFALAGAGLTVGPRCPAIRFDWYTRVIPRLDPDIIFVSEESPDAALHSAARSRIFATASALSVRRLRANGRKVVILRSTPLPSDPAFDPLNCISQGAGDCAFRVEPTPTRSDRELIALAREPNTWFLDLDRLECPRSPVCDPVINDIIVRRDRLHLTATYASVLGPRIDTILHSKGILPRRRAP